MIFKKKLANKVTEKCKQMSDLDICQDDAEDKLKWLNIVKLPGPDQLHPRVLQETCASIAYPLYPIYSKKKLSTDVLPADWKLAEVTAVYKKGPKEDRDIDLLASLVCVIKSWSH